MSLLLPLLIIFVIGLVFTELSEVLHLPYISLLIIAGLLFGQSQLGLITTNESFSFLAEIGLIFVMFMSGSEIDLYKLRKSSYSILPVTLFSAMLVISFGIIVGLLYFSSFTAALVLAAVFVSNGMPLVVNFLNSVELDLDFEYAIKAIAFLHEIIAIALYLIVSYFFVGTSLARLAINLFLIFLVVIVLKSKIVALIDWLEKRETVNLFESRTRIILALLFFSVVVFSFIGVEPVIGAFLFGSIIGSYMKSQHFDEKIKTISYGFFVPIFYFFVGLSIDTATITSRDTLTIFLTIFIWYTIIKFSSVVFSTLIEGYEKKRSFTISTLLIIQLTTSLAIATSALEIGVINAELFSLIVFIVIIASTLVPILLSLTRFATRGRI